MSKFEPWRTAIADRVGDVAKSELVAAARAAAAVEGLQVESVDAVIVGNWGAMPKTVTARIELTHDRCRKTSYFVKKGAPVRAEIAGNNTVREWDFREMLVPVLAEDDVVVFPWLHNFRNLHDELLHADVDATRLVPVFQDVLLKLSSLWGRSFSRGSGTFEAYRGRLTERTAATSQLFPELRPLLRKPLRINGVAYASFAEQVDTAQRVLASAETAGSVTSHGDPHAKNVMVGRSDSGMTWCLVDFAAALPGIDFAWEIAKMVQFFEVAYMTEVLKARVEDMLPMTLPTLRDLRGECVINYEVSDVPSPLHSQFARMAVATGDRFGGQCGDRGWYPRFAAHLFSCLWGRVVYYQQYRDLMPFVIGEAARVFTQYLEQEQVTLVKTPRQIRSVR